MYLLSENLNVITDSSWLLTQNKFDPLVLAKQIYENVGGIIEPIGVIGKYLCLKNHGKLVFVLFKNCRMLRSFNLKIKKNQLP